MSNYKDLKQDKFKDTTDIVDSGTAGTKIAVGTTAQRGSTQGQIRYNTTTSKFELRGASAYNNVEFGPAITSVDDNEVDSAAGGNQTFVITGSNFNTGDVCSFVGSDGTTVTASTTTVNSATQITAVIAKNQFVNAKEPYDIKITGANGLIGVLADTINVDNDPVWQTSAGALTGSPFVDNGASINVTLSCTDTDGDTVTYAIQSGALPSGISLNTSSGVISGNTPDLGADTTYNFTVRATANSKTADRAFSMVIIDNAPPVWSTASGTILTVFDSLRSSASVTPSASDADGDTITYSVQSGSLPTGMSLNTSTCAITGTPDAVGTDTTSTFTLRASATGGTADREFSIVVKAPVQTVFTADGTWTVPTGLTAARILVVAGGGGGGTTSSARGGGGGAGGLIHIPSWNVTGSASYAITIGDGGSVQSTGSNTTVVGDTKTLTANGGGAGKGGDHVGTGGSGGSGGGTWYGGSGGSSTQAANTSDGVNTHNSTGYGNNGGNASTGNPWGSAGGGAGGAGGSAPNQNGGAGVDLSGTFGSSVGDSGYFASGGNSANHNGSNSTNVLGGGGTCNNSGSGGAANADDNTGGGGGCGGTGGSGVVIFKY